MNNINPLNNNINFQNISQAKAGIVGDSQNSQQQASQLAQQTNAQNMQIINPALVYNHQMAKMDNEVVLKYLQNLLNLPNSIEKFVNQLNSQKIDNATLQILTQNIINTKALSEFLNQNSTQAISKLLQTISNSLHSGINDITQLKEVLSILTTIQSTTNISPNTIKEFLLLYIPLNIPVYDKQGDFNKIENENIEKIKNSILSIMIQTINFSNILCCLNQDNNNLFIDFYSNEIFPVNIFTKITTTISKEANINSYFEFKMIKNSNQKYDIQNFKVISSGFIPADSLILAHLITKTIFKIDNDFSII